MRLGIASSYPLCQNPPFPGPEEGGSREGSPETLPAMQTANQAGVGPGSGVSGTGLAGIKNAATRPTTEKNTRTTRARA